MELKDILGPIIGFVLGAATLALKTWVGDRSERRKAANAMFTASDELAAVLQGRRASLPDHAAAVQATAAASFAVFRQHKAVLPKNIEENIEQIGANLFRPLLEVLYEFDFTVDDPRRELRAQAEARLDASEAAVERLKEDLRKFLGT